MPSENEMNNRGTYSADKSDGCDHAAHAPVHPNYKMS